MIAERITDLSVWDSENFLTENETAYLWNNLEPPIWLEGGICTDLRPDQVLNTFEFLTFQRETGKLTDFSEIVEVDRPYGLQGTLKIRGATLYSREELRKLAERLNRRPLFLFPELREIKHELTDNRLVEASDNYPKGRDQHSVKNLIAAMATLLHGSTNWSYDVDSYAKELLKDFSIKGIGEPLEIRTLTKWLNKAAATLEKK